MRPFANLKNRLNRWLRNEDGGVIGIEFMIAAPIIVTLTVIFFGGYQAYRKEVVGQRASVTVVDALSRELDFVNDAYIDGMASLLNFMTNTTEKPGLRVTALRWELSNPSNPDSGRLRVVWSEVRNKQIDRMRNSNLNTLAERLPTMVPDQRIILTETWLTIEPPTKILAEPYTEKTFDFMFPRFADRVCFNNTPDNPDAALC